MGLETVARMLSRFLSSGWKIIAFKLLLTEKEHPLVSASPSVIFSTYKDCLWVEGKSYTVINWSRSSARQDRWRHHHSRGTASEVAAGRMLCGTGFASRLRFLPNCLYTRECCAWVSVNEFWWIGKDLDKRGLLIFPPWCLANQTVPWWPLLPLSSAGCWAEWLWDEIEVGVGWG